MLTMRVKRTKKRQETGVPHPFGCPPFFYMLSYVGELSQSKLTSFYLRVSFIISFQPSPVQRRIRVRNAMPKDQKFASELSVFYSFTVANRYTPRIAKINSKSIISAPTLAREGIVNIIVLKMTLKNLAFLISLKIRPILKARATVACFGPKFPCTLWLIMSVTQDTNTMKKSKIFQPLLK